MRKKRGIIVFAKEPVVGRVKTRLTPPLSSEEARDLYEAFLRDVLETAREAARDSGADLFLAWSGDLDHELVEGARGAGVEVVAQVGGDLGARMQGALSGLRAHGYDEALIVGTDSPTLAPEHFHTAFLLLAGADVVFGPSFDGGYYLVGVAMGDTAGSAPPAEEVIFAGIPWSTSEVLTRSFERAKEGGLLCDLLGFWYDVDTEDELKMLHFQLLHYLPTRDPGRARWTRRFLESRPSLLTHHIETPPSQEST